MKRKLARCLLTLSLFLILFPSLALAQDTPKYVFLFIGDGQSIPQITAARYYLGTVQNLDSDMPVPGDLSFTDFPHIGLMRHGRCRRRAL